jgi:hypothetical protein
MIRSEAPVELSSDKAFPAEEDTLLDAGSEKQEIEVTLEGPVEKKRALSQQGSMECPRKAIQDDNGGTDYVTAFRQRRKTRYDFCSM